MVDRIAIIGGRVVDPSQKLDGIRTVLIEKGRILQISDSKKCPSNFEILDAHGLVVSPGFIDLHTHLRDPGFEYREDIESGSRAAAAGGFTTIICMANTDPVNDTPAITRKILNKARLAGLTRILPVGAVTRGLEGQSLTPMASLQKAGCVAFSDDGQPVGSAALMRHALEYAKTLDAVVITHAEEKSLSRKGGMHEGAVSCRLGIQGIPPAAEEVMIYRDIALAEWVGARLHVAHVSTARGIDLVAQGKKRGAPVTCEVTPHHLLRTAADTQALIKAIQSGVVDAIATDHAPHGIDEKHCCFDSANFGLIGMETALPLLLQLVDQKIISMTRLIALLTQGPARVLGLEYGTLKKGALADVTLFNPSEKVVIDPTRFESRSRNTPFAGKKLQGRVQTTIFGGKIAYPFK